MAFLSIWLHRWRHRCFVRGEQTSSTNSFQYPAVDSLLNYERSSIFAMNASKRKETTRICKAGSSPDEKSGYPWAALKSVRR